ncbi:MAG: cell division protein FtsH [Parcubacteria group bacterium CG1_02_40_82]|uniref:ATP-dependent zinc metalloprotease FtsH n=3 Tax=Candidatus Portnoyibacteriota TaxID=1817913 RepID=A0A2H0KS40_9BACT|nr:MAG: cell division protein FtsH [Parcubacteria group bacterium CG1_02_40_82]PIQ74917.1 MAG: cell division protein FtsH [Candidatus Portnoybacteria bacterium CG11_big_fil_rev_8_21_14_0_20_40_15]PIS31988.1 MAG: cell division protein FtsH [Candidatus Portnoybacteria bacterium CG08_land_8_20_14_0_20_40_83]PIY74181.1 MAG: cell division protein FtsH [Candidatus Portnoybacteria bacterium CG_4_10_14_0_8_um_filter_40_50]PJA64694.1 MAG: cell division protein FtsH [Candidatus Portnoybacteria bacterium 
MKNLAKNIFIILIIFLAISVIFSLFSQKNTSPKGITLTGLVQQINDGKVSKIVINGQDINVTLSDGTLEKTTKEEQAALSQTLKDLGADPAKIQQVPIEISQASTLTFWLTTLLPFILPLLLIGLFLWFMLRQAQRGANQAFGFTKSLVRMLSPQDKKGQRTTFKDVAGLQEAKEELKEVIEFLKQPEKFKAVGAHIPKGVLLVGPPGTGKTLLARAVSGEANVPFFHISGSEFVELFVGVGASRVRDTFTQAKKSAPSILFVDELDAIGRHRGAGLGGGHDEREQTLNQILVEMDGFDPETRVVVISATNRPDILDPALLRPGRFDRRIILDLPDITDREQILKIHAKDKPLTKKVDLRQIAERTPGFSGADLANLMNEAAIFTARKNKKEISMEELIPSVEKVLLGPERKSHILNEKEKKIAAWHEAGHALVNASLPHTDPVRKVSIIARGRAAGYTLKQPTEDKHLRTKTEFLEELTVLMGGYAAEKLIFGEITTGSSNDLEQATDLARKLVTRFGMSDKLGPRTFGEQEELIFLGKEIVTEKDYSDKTAAQIDDEVTKFISDAQKVAQNIVIQKRTLLDKIANELIEKETIEKEEFERIMAQGQ